jgi:hypothetical protein
MNCLFKYSLENQLPIDLIYMNNAGEVTYRVVIVRKITIEGILTLEKTVHTLILLEEYS